jgi:hypothetical protein
MITALQNVQSVIFNLVHQSMFIGYASAPAAGEVTF